MLRLIYTDIYLPRETKPLAACHPQSPRSSSRLWYQPIVANNIRLTIILWASWGLCGEVWTMQARIICPRWVDSSDRHSVNISFRGTVFRKILLSTNPCIMTAPNSWVVRNFLGDVAQHLGLNPRYTSELPQISGHSAKFSYTALDIRGDHCLEVNLG